MNPSVVLGLDFGGTKIAAAVADPAAVRLGTAVVDTLSHQGAPTVLSRGVAAARDLLAAVAPDGDVIAVGVTTMGIPGEDGVTLAPTVPGWDRIALGRELAAAFPGAEVRLATDVKAAAGVEATSGALAGFDPGLYLNLGTGLAVAIVVGGTVLAGRHGAAGEIGYNLRSVDDVGRDATDRVPLEDAVSGQAFMRAATSLWPGIGAGEAFARAATDPRAAAQLEAFIAELGLHLVNLTIAIDPARIAVGGGMVRAWSQFEPGLRRALDAAVPFPPELVRAAFPFDAPLRGALALGLDAARGRHLPHVPHHPALISINSSEGTLR